MIKIIDKPGTGKTSRLLLLAKENNGVVVCDNPAAMREKAYAYGLTGIDFLTYESYAYENNEEFDGRPIFIDDLELFLRNFDFDIKGFTLTEGDNNIL